MSTNGALEDAAVAALEAVALQDRMVQDLVMSIITANTVRSVAVAAAAMMPSLVQAQEYCVTCIEPNATYRCQIAGARPGLSQSLQVACITALAKSGRHATCAIKSGVTVFECDGRIETVAVGSPASDDAAPAAVVVPPPPPAPADPAAPPKTMLEAAKRAQVATDAGMRKAGDATAGFFKRTVTCFGSLFTRCGGDGN